MQICLASQADSLLSESPQKPQIIEGTTELKLLSLPYSLTLGSIYLYIKSSMVLEASFFLCLLINHSRVELLFLNGYFWFIMLYKLHGTMFYLDYSMVCSPPKVWFSSVTIQLTPFTHFPPSSSPFLFCNHYLVFCTYMFAFVWFDLFIYFAFVLFAFICHI